MSTSPTFKYRGPDKRCPFPFDRDSVTVPTMSDAAYEGRHALLPEADGDEGLAVACLLWWLTESFTLTLTATAGSDTGTLSFPRPSFPAPASRCNLEGQLANPEAPGGIVWEYTTISAPTWGPDPTSGYQVVGIRYAQDVGRWCLVLYQYLDAYAYHNLTGGVVSAHIGGPGPSSSVSEAIDPITGLTITTRYERTSAGNVTVLGHDFPLYKDLYNSDAFGAPLPSGSVSGTSSSTFYTLV